MELFSKDKMTKAFQINQFLTVKLENGETNVYVNDKLFTKCKFLLLNTPSMQRLTTSNNFTLDELSKIYGDDLELRYSKEELGLSPEEEFRGHCSNLQAWAESGYSTNLLHTYFAFPLLKKLTEAGDRQAEEVFKGEVAKRFLTNSRQVLIYLVEEGYFEFLKMEEFSSLLTNIDFDEVDLYEFVDGIIDYYRYKFPQRYSSQILEEFPKTLFKEQALFYFHLLKKLAFEGSQKAESLLIEEIKNKLQDYASENFKFLRKYGFLEYVERDYYENYLKEYQYPHHKYTLRGHIDRINCVIFSREDMHLLSAGGPFDKSIRIWDLKTGKNINSLYGHTSDISSLALSPDDSYLASASWDKTIKIWDWKEGKLKRTLKGHRSWIRHIIFHPQDNYLISASGDNRMEEYAIKVWSMHSGRVVRTIEDFMNDVNCVQISPNGNYILTVSSESRVRDFTGKIWEFSTGNIYGTLEIYSKSILCAKYSPNGEYILSGSEDGTLRLWTSNEGELVLNLDAHKRPILSVDFSRDGTKIISSSGDGTIKIWDKDTGDLILTLLGHSSNPFLQSWINSIAVSYNNKHLASGAMDNSIKLWNCDFDKL